MSGFGKKVASYTEAFEGRHGFSPKGPRGPTDGGDGMDARLGKVEVRLDKLDDRLRGVEVGLATLTERVAHLPSKGFIVTATISALGLLSAIMLFADKIKAALGI